MKYEFGVMSSRYSLESESIRTAKLAMALFMRTPAPIVIYKPDKDGFMPSKILSEESSKQPPSDLKEVWDSIEECVEEQRGE